MIQYYLAEKVQVFLKKVHNKISLKLKIPMIKKYRSLNLSTSVSILLSENLRQTKYLNGFRS